MSLTARRLAAPLLAAALVCGASPALAKGPKVARELAPEADLKKNKKLRKLALEAFVPQLGHARHVYHIHLSASGRVVTASGIDDGTVKVWDVATGDLLRTFAAEDHAVIAPDGSWVATGDADGPIVVWDVATGAQLEKLAGHGPLALSPDGATLVGEADPADAVGEQSPEGRVRLWKTADWSPIGTFEGHRAPLTGVSFSKDAGFLATASYDSSVKVWDLKSGSLARTIQREGRDIGAIALSPDAERLAISYREGAPVTEVWDVSASSLERTLEGHTRAVSGLAFSPDGETLASAALDDTTRRWSVADGSLIETLPGGGAVAYSTDGATLAHGYQAIELLTKDGKKSSLDANDASVFTAAFSSDGERLIATDVTSRVDVWDAKTGKLSRSLDLRELGLPEGEVVVAASGEVAAIRPFEGNEIVLFGLGKGEVTGKLVVEGYDAIRSVVLSPDGSELVVEAPAPGRGDSTQLVWYEVATGKAIVEARVSGYLHVDGFIDGGENVALVSTGTSSGKSKLTLKVWERKTGFQKPVRVKGIAPYSGDISFGASSPRVALGDADSSVKLYERETNAPGAVLKGHTDVVNIAELSADGSLVATASWDKTVRVWDAGSGELLLTVPTLYKAQSLAFSPDGTMLAAAHSGWVRTIHLPTGRARTLYRHGDGWLAHDNAGRYDCGGAGCALATWRDAKGALLRDSRIKKALVKMKTF
jgi:WD40 repeat protein